MNHQNDQLFDLNIIEKEMLNTLGKMLQKHYEIWHQFVKQQNNLRRNDIYYLMFTTKKYLNNKDIIKII